MAKLKKYDKPLPPEVFVDLKLEELETRIHEMEEFITYFHGKSWRKWRERSDAKP